MSLRACLLKRLFHLALWAIGLALMLVALWLTDMDTPPAGVAIVPATNTATPTAVPIDFSPDPKPTGTPRPTATLPAPDPAWGIDVPWEVDCTDDDIYNGYMNQGYCVPGWVSWESSHFRNPRGFGGGMSSYAQGVMEIVCNYRNLPCKNYRGAAAVMGCGNIGNTAYVRREGGEWWGPLLIVDCTGQKDAFVNILVHGLAIEVDYETARDHIGALTLPWVEVRINSGGVPGGYSMPLAWWWKDNLLAWVWPGQTTPIRPVDCGAPDGSGGC